MIERIIAGVSRCSLVAATLACLGSLGLVCYGVGMRYFFGQPQPEVDELVGWLMVATVMLAMPEAQRLGEHVAVDSLLERLEDNGRRILAAIGLLAVAATAVILVYEGWAMVAFSRMVGLASNISGAPVWFVQLLVPVGFALLLLVALLQLGRMARGQPPVPPEAESDDPLAKIKAGPLE
jgi:TRAP-type C4-dicarboxylate transport system permease small subunit